MENNQSEPYLIKQFSKLFHRIERILVPSDDIQVSNAGPMLSKLLNKIKTGYFFEDICTLTPGIDSTNNSLSRKRNDKPIDFVPKRVKWDILEPLIREIVLKDIDESEIPEKIAIEIEMERKAQVDAAIKSNVKMKIQQLQLRNNLPVIPGLWRKKPYPKRQYVPLTNYQATESISPEEGSHLLHQLDTTLDGFLGPSYNYDDNEITEEWMCSFKDVGKAGGGMEATEDEVIRTQIVGLLEVMVGQVQDRVCNSEGVLKRPPIGLGTQLREALVWGIDCYTHKNIELSILDNAPTKSWSSVPSNITRFIEKRLLPCINAQSADTAHNMTTALQYIISDVNSTSTDIEFAQAVLHKIEEVNGIGELFRIHPKGTGVICSNPDGIRPHVVISDYLGEVYPPYRWCERIDVVEQARETFGLKPTLPDFYNILLERPRHDPGGYGLLFVDASQRANMGSSCSHSCDSNCTSAVVARGGKLLIVLTTVRHVAYGEELTMDYNSITTSDIEWRAAICLCGMSTCRGSFLTFATQDDLQQVLNQNCGPLWRYASLLRACAKKPVSTEDEATLARHGMLSVALGNNPPGWVKRFIADNLRFVEFERKALPCALMRAKNGEPSMYTFSSADADARVVMEQRLQSMVCSASMVGRVLSLQPKNVIATATDSNTLSGTSVLSPLTIVPAVDAAQRILKFLCEIPNLIEKYLLFPLACNLPALTVSVSAVPPKKKSSSTTATSNNNTTTEVVESKFAKYTDTWRSTLNKALHKFKSTTNLSSSSSSLPLDPLSTDGKIIKLINCIEEIRNILKTASSDDTVIGSPSKRVKGLGWIRGICFSIRQQVQTIEDLSTPYARLSLLSDLLVLWSNTSNFSTPFGYAAVDSDTITVPARELGTSIPYSKIIKLEPTSKRRKENATVTVTDNSAATVTGISSSSSMEVHVNGFSSCIDIDTEVRFAGKTNIAIDVNATEHSDIPAIDHASIVREINQVEVTEANDDTDNGQVFKEMYFTNDGATQIEPEYVLKPDQEPQEDSVDAVDDENDDPLRGNFMNLDKAYLQQAAVLKPNTMLDPNEPVFTGRKLYNEKFVFEQLVEWYKAGSGDPETPPDLFGSVHMPIFSMCFGESKSAYGDDSRRKLLSILRNEKVQVMPWPQTLRDCFTVDENALSTWNSTPLMGSPMLDVALGQVDAMFRVMKDFGTTSKKFIQEVEECQPDDSLPPEVPTEWIQCEGCHKWRRVAWFVDIASLSDSWVCADNFWDCEVATCEAPQDFFDPEMENTINTAVVDRSAVAGALKVNDKKDVFCLKNRVYYEGHVVKIFDPTNPKDKSKIKGKGDWTKKRALFHFKGWSSCMDEWIDADSDRIADLYLYTNPIASKPKEQEKWQGVIDKAAAAAESKKEQRKDIEDQKLDKKSKSKKRAGIVESVSSSISAVVTAVASAVMPTKKATKSKAVTVKPTSVKPTTSKAAASKRKSVESDSNVVPVDAIKKAKTKSSSSTTLASKKKSNSDSESAIAKPSTTEMENNRTGVEESASTASTAVDSSADDRDELRDFRTLMAIEALEKLDAIGKARALRGYGHHRNPEEDLIELEALRELEAFDNLGESEGDSDADEDLIPVSEELHIVKVEAVEMVGMRVNTDNFDTVSELVSSDSVE